MLTYHHPELNKAGWENSPGPWVDEPDKAQWVDETTDLDCLIVRNGGGALCGYVGLPPGHPLHGVDYGDERMPALDVHGGLTFAALCHESPLGEGYGVCHRPEPGRPDAVWWLGFDAAHAGDLSPAYRSYPFETDTYRDLEYVRGQCADLARQLARVA
jgi:hypothetical protein